MAVYVQTIKITRKLTLNLGLRIEHESPVTERFNRSATGSRATRRTRSRPRLSRTMPEPDTGIACGSFKVNGGLAFAGERQPAGILGWAVAS
jgi:hypothetical protein